MGHVGRRSALVAAVAASLAVALSGVGAATPSATRSRAEQAARGVLSQFHVPPGSRSIASPPRGTNPNIFVPMPLGHGEFGSPYLVDRHRYFLVPGTAQDSAAWIVAHPPAGWSGFIISGRCRSHVAGKRCLMAFAHGDAGVFKGLDPQLLVKAIQISGRRSVARVDTDLAWLGPRNQFDKVPTGATVMTVVAGGPGHHLLRTIRDQKTIDAFRRAISSLQVPPPNQICTSQTGEALLYSFKTTPRAAPLAQVFVDLSGCGTVDVEVHGHPGAEMTMSPSLQRHLP
jgi:hypothetical protein